MAAIWKDYYLEVEQVAAIDFRVCTGGYGTTVIYSGRAVAKPTGGVRVRINDICADYLRTTLPNFELRYTAGLLALTFYLQYKEPDEGSWTNYGTVTFTNNWSYDYDYDEERDGYSFPISKVVDPRQLLLMTVPAGTASVSATITNVDGSTQTVVLTVQRTADFNNDYNGDYSHTDGAAAAAGVVMLDLSQYPLAVKAAMGGHEWIVATGGRCADYAIYYVNAYGGWDALCLYGHQVDAYTRHEYDVDYDNTAQSAQGRVDYANEIDQRYRLRTPWLDALGGARMHNLTGTTLAVIHELATGRILPITVQTDSVEYKTYRSAGRTPISYELEVAVAQDRQRR